MCDVEIATLIDSSCATYQFVFIKECLKEEIIKNKLLIIFISLVLYTYKLP